MNRIVFAIALIPLFASAQSKKIITDSIGNHGFYLSDKQYLGFPSDFNRIGDSLRQVDPGWRMPTGQEMKIVFDKTFSKRLLASTYTNASCYTADTTVGIMRGREFQLTEPQQMGQYDRAYTLFFIKPF